MRIFISFQLRVVLFKHYHTFIQTQTGKSIKIVRTDQGGEYNSNAYKHFCTQNGIQTEYMAPYSPAQNGISEWLNHTIMDHTHAIMAGSNLPNLLWPIAILHFVWIKNRSLTTTLQGPTTPFKCSSVRNLA